MRVRNARDLGLYLRDQRREAGLTQQQLADQALVSRRWLSDLESGKPSAEVGLVLKVVAALRLSVDLQPAPEPAFDLDD
jgi:y4mF family transcriptional regulator